MPPQNIKKIQEKRKEILQKADELVEICKSCKLREPYTIDRKSPACDNCPTQAKLYRLRIQLGRTLLQIRRLRQKQ